jgi:hypothetical protein
MGSGFPLKLTLNIDIIIEKTIAILEKELGNQNGEIIKLGSERYNTKKWK